MAQPLIGADNTTVICCGLFTVNEDSWKGMIALTDGVKRTVVYVVGGSFSLLKQTTSSLDGWKKLASVIAPLAALLKFGKFDEVAEALEAISSQFDTFKLLQGGMSWINIGDDLFKKDFIEKHKSENHHYENYVAFVKRILLVGVNTLKLAKFGNKIGLCGDVVSDISKCLGGIPVMSILLAGVTTLSLIGNGLTFWTISDDKDEVSLKINRFLNNQSVSPEKTLVLKAKLKALMNELAEAKGEKASNFVIEADLEISEEGLSASENEVELEEITKPQTELKLPEELPLKEVVVVIEPEDKFANFSYPKLKLEIALRKNELKLLKASKVLDGKRAEIAAVSIAINEARKSEKGDSTVKALEDQKLKLILNCTKIAAEFSALNAEVRAHNLMDTKQFQGFKNVQYFGRMSELDQKKNKELRDFACNLLQIPGIVLGIVKDYSGLGTVMNLANFMTGGLLDIDDEDTMKAIISGISLITGSAELAKFLYEENYKDEQQRISAAEYVALAVA